MSIRVTFDCACHYLQLDDYPVTSDILGDVLCDMAYVFVESDIYHLPEEPVALISFATGEVDCVLTQSTWKFPASMPEQEALEMTSVMISNEMMGHLHD